MEIFQGRKEEKMEVERRTYKCQRTHKGKVSQEKKVKNCQTMGHIGVLSR